MLGFVVRICVHMILSGDRGRFIKKKVDQVFFLEICQAHTCGYTFTRVNISLHTSILRD